MHGATKNFACNISKTTRRVSSDIHETPRSGFKNKVQPRFLRPTSTSWISDETLRIVFYIASQINNNLILEEIQR